MPNGTLESLNAWRFYHVDLVRLLAHDLVPEAPATELRLLTSASTELLGGYRLADFGLQQHGGVTQATSACPSPRRGAS